VPFDRIDGGRVTIPIEPIAYLTEPAPFDEWVSRVVIETAPIYGHDAWGLYEVPVPREAVVNLAHHVPLCDAPGHRYMIDRYAVAELRGAKYNVALEGSWSGRDSERSR
jgi:hypothetical protein